MKKIIIIICLSGLLGCSSKLKIYNQHALMKPVKLKKDNFYAKDFNGSFERLKGLWLWTDETDTLLLKIIPHYKKKYSEKVFGYKNAYYDTSEITFKYVKDGEVIVDNRNNSDQGTCLYASNLEIITTMFYVNDKCNIGGYSPPVLLFAGNNLILVNKWSAEVGIFFEKKGEYQIIIPRTITLKRLGGTSP